MCFFATAKGNEMTRGGVRKGAGKKPLYGKKMKACNITLPENYIKLLKDIGQGNLSRGVRLLVETSPRFPQS